MGRTGGWDAEGRKERLPEEGWGREEESNDGERSNWGPAGELRWSRSGGGTMAVRMEGTVSGEAVREGWGERGWRLSGVGPRARNQVKSGCTVCSHPHLQAPRGLPPPAHWPGGSCRCPVFCLLPLGIRFILWREELGQLQNRSGISPCPCPAPAPTPLLGSRSKSKGLPAPAASLTAPQAPQPSPNLLFSSSLQRGPFVVIFFFFLI